MRDSPPAWICAFVFLPQHQSEPPALIPHTWNVVVRTTFHASPARIATGAALAFALPFASSFSALRPQQKSAPLALIPQTVNATEICAQSASIAPAAVY